MSEPVGVALIDMARAAHPTSWTAAGWALVGAFLGGTLAAVTSGRLLADPGVLRRRPWVSGCAATAGLLVGILAVRFEGYELAAFACVACVGVVLAGIDLVERRLPRHLVLPGYGVVGGLLAAAAAGTERWSDLFTALAAALVVALAYFAVALASSGGLGSGDVTFGGLLGLAMGWQGWPTVITGTAVAWTGAAVVLLVLRCVGQRPGTVPMGPFLLVGAMVALLSG